MSFYTKITTDKDGLEQDAMRILRRLCEKGAVLAVAAEMDKAVVVRDGAHGKSTRTAVVERHIAQAMALKNWIAAQQRVELYAIKLRPQGARHLPKCLRVQMIKIRQECQRIKPVLEISTASGGKRHFQMRTQAAQSGCAITCQNRH